MSELHKACVRGDLKEVTSLLSIENINTQNRAGETPLYVASKYGDLNTVKVLTSWMECNLNIPDEYGDTPLHRVCMYGNHSIIEFLVADQRCQLNIQNREGKTPIHLASEYGHLDAVKVLLSREECDFDIPDEQGNTPLHKASEYGYHSVVQFLAADHRCQLNTLSNGGESPLFVASKYGHLDTVKALVSSKECDLNTPDERGNTPLHMACKHGHHSTVQILVADQRCQLNAKNREGETLLHATSECGNLETVKVLVGKKECDLNMPDNRGNTPLHMVCKHGHHSTVEFLVADQRCQINAKNKEGETPLHIASEHGHLDTVKGLVSRKECDLNIPDYRGNTPLHTACKHGHYFTVGYLVADQRCQLCAKNREGETPLHTASEHGNLDTVKVLVGRKDCDLNIPDDRGNTPLHTACKHDHHSVVQCLVADQRCQLNTKNSEMNTSLHIACHTKEFTIINLLLDRKCSITIPNKKAETAGDIPLNEDGDFLLHIACQWGDATIVKYLITVGRCNLNITNACSITPLYTASEHGHLHVVKVLVGRKECDLNIPDYRGNTPLHTACKHGHHSTVKFLVNNQRCQLHAKNRMSETPLHTASELGNLDIVKVLADMRECDLNMPDDRGNTPLHMACKHGHHSTVEFLVGDQRCQINAKNRGGETPLHTGSEHGHLDIVKVLVCMRECDLNMPDNGGNTALHTACKHGHRSTVQFLVADQRCQLNAKNCEINTPLHIACHTKALRIIRLLLERKCSITISNKKGETAVDIPVSEDGDLLLHSACQWGDAGIVRYLINAERCNLNIKNISSNTPLHTASKHGHLDVVKVLVSRKNCDLNVPDYRGNTPLHAACKHGHHSTVEFLVADHRCQLNTQNSELNTPLHIACHAKVLSIIRLLLERKCCTTIPNKKGETAQEIPLNEGGDHLLHIACQWGDVNMVRNLVTNHTCDPNVQNKYDLTPLLASIKHGNSPAAAALLQYAKCDLSLRDKAGNTALHLACISARAQTHPEMVKVAKKLIISADPLCVNSAGQTPIELTTNYELIQAISHFAKCKKKHSVQTYINIFIVGNPKTGKSTLVEAIRYEAGILWRIAPKFLRMVSNVPPHTAGIIPTTFRSKVFGNTVLYDLAGQIEYYTSHAAVIQTTVISTPPAFIVVVNMSESEVKISETLRYWWSFINNHAARASAPPQVILVGSHADKVKARGGRVQEKMSQVSAFLRRLPTSFYFAGQVALDCRDPASRELQLFRSLVNKSCCELRQTADVDLHCHVLYAFLLEKFPGKVACTISDIATIIQVSDALLPQNPDALIPLITTLSDKGLLLLVTDSGSSEDSWVILQKQLLLCETNGAIFAPKHFSQHKALSSSTGVVPLLKLKNEFPDYNPIMIIKFLTHLEFCFKIDDRETLDLLKDEIVHEENMPQIPSEDYYFFPALVSIENPLQVWEQDDVMIPQCGWFYRCIRNDQFLTTRFLHVLILRLAFSFALQLEPGDSHDDSLALCRRCSVWKHRIGWLNRVPIEAVVEVGLLKQSVIVMMRCPRGEEAKCVQLRSKIIQKVIGAKDEHCNAVKMSESFIHPTDIKYPFFDSSEDLKSYSLTEMARARVKEANNVLDNTGRNPFPMKDLLLFDPYNDTSTELLNEIFSEKHSLDEQVRGQVLRKLLEGEADIEPDLYYNYFIRLFYIVNNFCMRDLRFTSISTATPCNGQQPALHINNYPTISIHQYRVHTIPTYRVY